VDDPARIDSIVECVSQLLDPVKNAENDAFNEFSRDSWDAILTWFRNEVKRLEAQAEIFIDECFHALIRAEDGLAMLMKFRNMKTRESVQRQLATKFDVIMQQFSKEVNEVEEIFNKGMFLVFTIFHS
jgi:dynein heavy chain